MSDLSRRGLFGLGAGAAALAMAGCSDFTSSSSGSGSSSAGGSLVFRWWGGTSRNEAYQSALKVFTQKTGIKVTAQYSGYNGYFDKLNTEFAGGTPPDVFQMDTALTSTYAAKGVLSDLSKYIPGTIPLDTLFTQLRTAGTVKGVNYGIASGSGYAPVLYNETVLGKLKIAAPGELLDLGRLHQHHQRGSEGRGLGQVRRDGRLGRRLGRDAAVAAPARQGPLHLGGRARLRRGRPRRVLELLGGPAQDRRVLPADLVANYGNADSTNPFVAGSAALTNGWGLAQIAPLMTATLGEIIVPRGTNGKTGQALNGGVLLVIPTKSANPAGAAKLIDFFLTDTDAIKIMGTQRGLPPSTLAEKELLPTLSSSAKTDVTYGDYVNAQVAADKLADPPSAQQYERST